MKPKSSKTLKQMKILRLRKHPLDSIAKFKLEVEQSKAILKKHIKAYKKAKLLEKNTHVYSELANYQGSKTINLKQNLEIS